MENNRRNLILMFVFHQWYLHKLFYITYRDHITNEEILKRDGCTRLEDIVAERRFCQAGHSLRLPDQKTAMR